MDLVAAISAGDASLALLLFTGVAAPIVGLLLRRVGAGWNSIGKGPLAIEEPRPAEQSDPELDAAEVRQLTDLIGSQQ
ncbi:MAG: hypothetical protein JJE35_14460 [Thermoleophilia bacterium]|nr:hypothetical protein [Thermoleophilia bacterium]